MFRLRVNDSVEMRLLEPSHAEPLFCAIDQNRANLRQWLPWVDGSRSAEDTAKHIGEVLAMHGRGEALNAGIWIGGELAGAIGLHKIDRANRLTSIGYWLDSVFQGRGVMTNCCRAMVSLGFREFELNRMEIRCATENKRSCAIPERLGFTREGVLRDAEWVYDRFVDLAIYGMLEREWKG